jgi:5-hydroxyisourate hydrolase
MAGISTHVLDIVSGRPAAGMRIDFAVRRGGQWVALKTVHTNASGRTDEPVLAPADAQTGEYRLVFHVAAYFRAQDVPLADPPFLDLVPLRFGIASTTEHYHVPLLCSPWSYSTYRGS